MPDAQCQIARGPLWKLGEERALCEQIEAQAAVFRRHQAMAHVGR
jgi:hypothetical protein